MDGQNKTIEKPSSLMEKPLKNPLVPMVGQTKTIEKTSSLIEKPLENHRYQWFARPKTIDTNGCFPTIHRHK